MADKKTDENNSTAQEEHKSLKEKLCKKRVIVPFLFVTFFVLLGIHAFITSLSYQSTDDAFVEGRLIQIAPRVSGQVITLNVNDNDYVKEGDLLLEIDPNDYKNKVNELSGALKEAIADKSVASSDIDKSSANLADANKTLDFAKKDYIRYTKLKKNGLCTKQQYDMAETAYKQAI